MLRLTAAVPLCALALVGCGPLVAPMPARVGEEGQKKIDATWDRALTPPTRLARGEMLDALVGTRGYELGVDSFAMRSEKRFAGGKVVMEIAFDRTKPDDDRFEVSVIDTTGKLIRKERYTRDEVEESYTALFVSKPAQKADNAPDQPGMAAQRAEFDARWKKITDLFPQD
ncbi:MAG TPA: hypothetical protein VMZ71_07105 [Gemmataceae bacterium]|nr:hypothetical protein [Gemmataceae bacterium]